MTPRRLSGSAETHFSMDADPFPMNAGVMRRNHSLDAGKSRRSVNAVGLRYVSECRQAQVTQLVAFQPGAKVSGRCVQSVKEQGLSQILGHR
jgi:hypothetical protein